MEPMPQLSNGETALVSDGATHNTIKSGVFEGAPSQDARIEQGTQGIDNIRNDAALPTSGAPLILPPPIMPQAHVQSSNDDAMVSGGLPVVANDDDLIEKEWVDKAKQIIAETKDDPYRREQEVSKLQADYLKKRYGRVVGSA